MVCHFRVRLSRCLPALLLALALAGFAHAQSASPQPPPPTSHDVLGLAQLMHGAPSLMRGLGNVRELEFTLRKDQAVTRAQLDLVFTVSPALLAPLSHVRVYLNDELMAVVPLEPGKPGVRQRATVALDPRLVTSFNRIRLEFVGHYTLGCEDPANSALWLDLSRETQLVLDREAVPLADDLAYFPQPFTDPGSMHTQTIAFVFAGPPDDHSFQAAGVLASYFGSVSAWRALRFPVFYNQKPAAGHAVVFADNQHRPDFLRDLPAVDAPTVKIISAPGDPYQKLLLVLGRDTGDLLVASRALATGSPLFRGQSVRISQAVLPDDRQPYDAPAWTPTDRPVTFSELTEYPGQLEVSGATPAPITLKLNLPPDLFVWRNAGVPMRLRYRYTPPGGVDGSRLIFSLNHQFVDSVPLEPDGERDARLLRRLPLLENDGSIGSKAVRLPAFKIGADNQMRFAFSFNGSANGLQGSVCQTVAPPDRRASIDGNSTVDFSGHLHYMQMPNLQAFARSGFPFSRMADLSDTIVVTPSDPVPDVTATVLETLGRIGAQTGLPAFKVRILHDWKQARDQDADILWLGNTLAQMRGRPDSNLILEGARATLRQMGAAPASPGGLDQASAQVALTARPPKVPQQVELVSQAPLAAIVELQSPTHPQRSWVGLLASTHEDFTLLRNALGDSGKRDVMAGGVVVIRDSGVYGAMVGTQYAVGALPWWQATWYVLSDRPILLVFIALGAVLLAALLLWLTLRQVARRRLKRRD